MEWLSLPAFAPEECRRMVEELAVANTEQANVYGVASTGVVDERVRRVKRLSAPAAIAERVQIVFDTLQPQLAEHFGVALARFEEPQFLRYQTGDFFVAHQDGNTPLVYDDSRHRRISAIVFLSHATDYDGGAVRFLGRGNAPSAAGSLLAFRSELTHEVTPVERGERYTVVTWYR